MIVGSYRNEIGNEGSVTLVADPFIFNCSSNRPAGKHLYVNSYQ